MIFHCYIDLFGGSLKTIITATTDKGNLFVVDVQKRTDTHNAFILHPLIRKESLLRDLVDRKVVTTNQDDRDDRHPIQVTIASEDRQPFKCGDAIHDPKHHNQDLLLESNSSKVETTEPSLRPLQSALEVTETVSHWSTLSELRSKRVRTPRLLPSTVLGKQIGCRFCTKWDCHTVRVLPTRVLHRDHITDNSPATVAISTKIQEGRMRPWAFLTPCHLPLSRHQHAVLSKAWPSSFREARLKCAQDLSSHLLHCDHQHPLSGYHPKLSGGEAARRRARWDQVHLSLPRKLFLLTFRAQAFIQKFTKRCAYHEKWHLNGNLPRKVSSVFTKCCTCHEKWHLNFTKCCTCHEKWQLNFTKCYSCYEKLHLNFTKCCTCHEKWHLNLTKCCACHAKWRVCLILVTYETSFTMRGATSLTLQPHQKNCACHQDPERLACVIFVAYQTSFTMRGATGVTIQPHQILRLPRKITLQDFRENLRQQVKRHLQCGDDPTMIRAWNRQSATRLATEVTFRAQQEHFLLKNTTFRAQAFIQKFTKCCTCHEKWHLNVNLPRKVTLQLHQVLHLPRKVTLELHQVLHLPRKVTLQLHQAPATKSDTSTWPSAVPATKSDTWTSPSAAPATKSGTRHEKWHLNFTKGYTCHEKWHLNFTLRYSTLLESTLLDSTLLDSTLLYSTVLDSTLLDSALLDSTLLDSTLLDSTLLYSTLLDSTLLDSTLLDSTLLDSTLLYSTLLDSTLLDSTLLDSTLLDSTLLDSTLLDSTLLDSTLLYSTLLYSTLLDSTLLDSTLLDSTLLDSTLLDSTLLYSTLLDTAPLDSTLLDSTLLDTTLLDFTQMLLDFTEMLFVYRKFLS